MDILIIGNGFDLAHGMETSYKQFLEFVNKERLNGDSCYKECYQTNLWMKHFLEIQNYTGDNWINLESAIFDVIRHLKLYPVRKKQVLSLCMLDSHFNIMSMKLREPYLNETLLKEGYKNPNDPHYITYYFENNNDLINLLYRQLREFTKIFEKYLLEVVLSKKIKPFEFTLKNPVSILSFNYTDTFEKLYKQDITKSAIKPRYVYVHGRVCDNGKCRLVLGTHSFLNIDPDNHQLNIPVEYNVFKKHNQRHKYNTIEPYQELIQEITNLYKEICPTFHIVGHSLDKTDHNILKHILLANPKSVINIYYHNEEAQERMINNITEIIGEEEVMSKVRFIHQHDDERSILKRIN